MTALIPDKIDFRVKTNTKKRGTLFKMIKYSPGRNNNPKYIHTKQKNIKNRKHKIHLKQKTDRG